MKKDINSLIPLIEKAMEENGTVRLYPHGKSMLPMIREGIDSVVLQRPDEIEENDIVLFIDKNGDYTLHRVTKIKNGVYHIYGDNCSVGEKLYDKSKIISKVKCFYRGDTLVENNNDEYLRYIEKIKKSRFLRRIKRKITKPDI